MKRPYMRWTDAEVAILHEIWAQPETIESQAHRLPGRPVERIRHKARAIGLGAKPRLTPGWTELCKVMAHGLSMTAKQAAQAVNLSEQQARELLDRAVAEQRAHIANFQRHPRTGAAQKVYRIGSGTNAKRPDMLTRQQSQERWKAKQDPHELFVRRRRYYTRKKIESGTLARRDPLTAALFGSV
ncbi:bacteriophage protein [Pandoraea captiosa]|uniref:Bacteriophage protein n=1 Tax=Pandoraea captiosa TaxID=2508302 RepID=A0A5E5AK61_9BURK|nr:hypothetical protein [Pandoraea captiosa]VVE74161.1 bacteriophage protein [Pandoraea captiosa]